MPANGASTMTILTLTAYILRATEGSEKGSNNKVRLHSGTPEEIEISKP